MKDNEYAIKNIEDFLQVPPEKLNACLIDFILWIKVAEQMERIYPAIKSTDFELKKVFHWIDDGMTGVSEVDVEFKPTVADK